MRQLECKDCGLCAFDLPDGIGPELIFQCGGDGVWRCAGCEDLHRVHEEKW